MIKKFVVTICFVLMLVGATGFPVKPGQVKEPTQPVAVSARYAPMALSSQLVAAQELPPLTPPKTSGSSDSRQMVQVLMPNGLALRPNLQYHAFYSPTDQPAKQWYIPRIAAPQAWDLSTGAQTTTVAVIDTGFGLQHDELSYRWATNSGERGGGKETNGIDDDSNGYVDDWRGWDFYHNDNTPNAGSDNAAGEAVYHGTSVAGLVGAEGNNNLGVASINWQTRILPVQALDDDGMGYSTTVAAAIHYAVNRGADVINLSLGVDIPDDIIKAQIDYASAHDVLVVAASGNDGCNCVAFPANYPEVLSVGASDKNDKAAWFSNYGPNLDVVAPGSGTMLSPQWSADQQRSGYSDELYGTSFASPIVSGLAALLKGANSSLSAQGIANYIKDHADTVPAMNQSGQAVRYGNGRINAYRSIRAVNSALRADTKPTTPLYRLYKTGAADIYTTSLDQRNELVTLHGYQYEIVRFAAE